MNFLLNHRFYTLHCDKIFPFVWIVVTIQACEPLPIRLAPVDEAAFRSCHTRRYKLRAITFPSEAKKATPKRSGLCNSGQRLFLPSSLLRRPSSLGRSTDLGFGGSRHNELLLGRLGSRFCHGFDHSFNSRFGLGGFHLSPSRFLSSGNFSTTGRTHSLFGSLNRGSLSSCDG